MPESNLFDFLDRSLNVLIVDNDPEDREQLLNLLGGAHCYETFTAASNRAALGLLQSGKRFHACIIELGIGDVDNDQFFLLRHYAQHTSMLVLTRSTSPHDGALAVQLGARTVFEKCRQFDKRVFFRTLSRMALVNIVNHRWNEWSNDTLNIAVKMLFEYSPESVTQWAEHLKISDRQLRNLWHFSCGFGAKQVLFLYQCYRAAFDYHDAEIFGNGEERKNAGRFFRKRMASYFLEHREVLTFMLS